MFQQFYHLFCALEEMAQANTDKDLTTIENAKRELFKAWSEYNEFSDLHMTADEAKQFVECFQIVFKF